jgi:diguanylate cyclase (GGDEF)-like protein
MIAARASDRGCGAVVLLDVDRFKEINEALGHDLGDLLLQELGKRLSVLVEPTETLARLGGDEFGILLPDASAEQAAAVAERLHQALETPFALRGLPLEIAMSAGVAVYPDHGGDVETLLRHADVAMYFAKDSHLRTAVYDTEQDTSDAARLALAGELRGAIERGELLVFFQPKADLVTGRVVGAEALVRWQHPERGFIPPNEFIPIAERTGLIKPLSRYVLAAAIRQCAAWDAAGFSLCVSVNVTVPDLLDPDFPERITTFLDGADLSAEQLELELTETTILADPLHVREVLTRLNEIGLRSAIDDFGTGYSSLAYLRRLPVHTIKIDRSFVMGMCEDANDATIVRSTIDLGRNLGLEVVAEGVETQEVWNELRALGCSLAQGYLLGRPMSAAELAPLLEERGVRRGAAVEAGLVRL